MEYPINPSALTRNMIDLIFDAFDTKHAFPINGSLKGPSSTLSRASHDCFLGSKGTWEATTYRYVDRSNQVIDCS